jgi:hypothetical protein
MESEGEGRLTPFTIIVDSAEQQPFAFAEISCDAKHKEPYWQPQTITRCLGRHPNSQGDYSLAGYVGQVGVERKSLSDMQGTLLGWSDEFGAGRRDRFESELANLSNMPAGLVVVEATFFDVIRHAPQTAKRTSRENAKILSRSIIAYQQDYLVRWIFCDSRRLAEVVTFRWMERFWQKREAERKRQEKLANIA